MPGSKSLSNISEEATELKNTAGVLTPVLELSPDDGLLWEIMNSVPQGDAPGIPIYMKLKDSNGDPIPLQSVVALGFEAPTDDSFRVVSDKRDNVQAWNARSISEQQNEEYVDASKIELKGRMVRSRHIDSVYVLVESDSVVEWANSQLYIDEKAVRERSGN